MADQDIQNVGDAEVLAANESHCIDELEIRDTSDHDSDIVFNGVSVIKTIIIENSLNQAVTFQCKGSANADFSNSFNIGSSFDVSATTNTYQSCDTYIPYWRITASCSTAPTSGKLTVITYGL